MLFGWPTLSGALLGAGLVLAYCLAGGLRVSIWTDAAQSVLMMAAMWVLLFAALSKAGGFEAFFTQLEAVAPGHLDLGQQRFGGFGPVALFAIGLPSISIATTGRYFSISDNSISTASPSSPVSTSRLSIAPT